MSKRKSRPQTTTWLYGCHAVAAAWLNPRRSCKKLLATSSGIKTLEEALNEAKSRNLSRPVPEIVTRDKIVERLLPGAVHQGLALMADPLAERTLADILAEAKAAPRAVLVVLDQVTDPHNVGAILRSAAAFGAAGVIVTRHHAPEPTGALAKSATGAVEHVPLVSVGNLARALEDAADAGFVRIGLDERGETVLTDANADSHVVIALGSEGDGLRRLTRERCDKLARLPTQGPVRSLNVSVAAAIALYELARK
ncbi:MAG: 23S rRNA (guanosine(2251)-2'-O)-methyltransferase RlmB [Pseudomonadota bacterium]|nr:23S rRNA (guanosine(2251)-2'-O)-methyltransferase RlmB [Pseudomonadota bacterium]